MKRKKFGVIYSIGAPFGGVGVGYTAYNAVKWGSYKYGHLQKLICRNFEAKDMSRENVVSFPWIKYIILPFRAAQMLFKWDWICPFSYTDRLYGWLAAKQVTKCDIFHSWMGYSSEGLKKAKKLGAIKIIECASSHPRNQMKLLQEEHRRFPFSSSPPGESKDLERLEQELTDADYIMIPSDFVEQSFIEQGFSRKKLIKIPFGVDLQKFSSKKNKKDKKFRCICVGSIQLRKGIQYILRAWDELKLENAELIVVGRVYPDVHKIVAKYKGNPTIKFIGFADPRKYYKISDVFVFPSIEEGSALVGYEAMASSLPLITTFNSGSIARNNKEGFIIPLRNNSILKEKIKFMYDNPKICEKMGRAARKLVENYTWEKYGERLVKEYERVIEERKKA